jgi:hypothetical protein
MRSCADLNVLNALQCGNAFACAAHLHLGVRTQSTANLLHIRTSMPMQEVRPERALSAWLQYKQA